MFFSAELREFIAGFGGKAFIENKSDSLLRRSTTEYIFCQTQSKRAKVQSSVEVRQDIIGKFCERNLNIIVTTLFYMELLFLRFSLIECGNQFNRLIISSMLLLLFRYSRAALAQMEKIDADFYTNGRTTLE